MHVVSIFRGIAGAALSLAIVATAQAQYSGGSGTAEDPYQIATAADLIALGETPDDYDKHFILTADIDLDPNLPGRKVFDGPVIGVDENNYFTGAFDGNGHTISNLTITGWLYVGLFGLSDFGAKISNLGLEEVEINGSGPEVGSLVGRNEGAVINCYSTGAVSGEGDVGGLVGENRGTIVTSYSAAAVSGVDNVGGLVGLNYGGRVSQCYSSGVVVGGSCVGGLVGVENPWPGRGTIIDSYSTAAVSATTGNAGGLVGVGCGYGTVIRCYSAGPVTAPLGAGGLAGGSENGDVADVFWDIETSGQTTSAGGTGKTTAEMQDPNTFMTAGWDFVGQADGPHDIWAEPAGGGYPVLYWQLPLDFGLPTFSGGTGEPNDPYLIATAQELNSIGHNPRLMKCHFKLVADLDLTGVVFYPIGGDYYYTPYEGVFDGNAHTISHMTLEAETYGGLFVTLASGAAVKNVGLIDVNISGGHAVGGLIGYNGGQVTGCYVTGTITGSDTTGGLVGRNQGDIAHCYSSVAVDGGYYGGGLVGSNGGRITMSYSTGVVNADPGAGGLVGYATSDSAGLRTGRTTASLWDMDTSGVSCSAGGIGLTTAEMMDPDMFGLNGFANDPHWVLDAGRDYPRLAWEGKPGDVIGEPSLDWMEGQGVAEAPHHIDSADQLILLCKANILWDRHFVLGADIDVDPAPADRQGCPEPLIQTFDGVFDGDNHTISHLSRGLFGHLRPGAEVRDLGVVDANVIGPGLVKLNDGGAVVGCYITGAVHGGAGLVGTNAGAVLNCYNTAAVSGSAGLVGNNYGDVIGCYNTGAVSSGGNSAGGLVGNNEGHIANCFNRGPVSGDNRVGGLVGNNETSIVNCYSRGAVKGDRSVGGLIGDNGGKAVVTYSYSTGAVSGREWVGGFTGGSFGLIMHSFWDTLSSGQTEYRGGMRRTTEEMQTVRTFLAAGWDFAHEIENGTEDLWWILEGQDYPTFVWEPWAYSPGPPDGATHVPRSTILDWDGEAGIAGHDVYFGDDENMVAHATPDTPGIYRGRQPAQMTSYDPGLLELGTTYYWRIDPLDEGDPDSLTKGSVWSFTVVEAVMFPLPTDGAVNVNHDPVLSWVPGAAGLHYDVYFGEDRDSVAQARPDDLDVYCGRQLPGMTTYEPGHLEWVKTYYWRVDAVDDADPSRIWQGSVWSFDTANFILVDDFESYDDDDWSDTAIYWTWIDFWMNNTGSLVMVVRVVAPYVEEDIVYAGCQAMSLYYNNTDDPWYSETERTWETPQDWTMDGVDTLTLYVHGAADNHPERLYVAIEDSAGQIAVVVHPDAEALSATEWQKWHIPLANLQADGVDVSSIKKMIIGVGDRENPQPGGEGLAYFDDIMLTNRMP